LLLAFSLLLLTSCTSDAAPPATEASEADLKTADGASRGRARLLRTPSGVEFASDVAGLPVGHYFVELRTTCDSAAGSAASAHRLLMLVGVDGVGFSRSLIREADQPPEDAPPVAVLHMRDQLPTLACGAFEGGFP
jgi:hypothetical protein